MKLYGKSAQTSASSVNPTIIENPELLRLREEEKARAKAAAPRYLCWKLDTVLFEDDSSLLSKNLVNGFKTSLL